MDRVVEKKIDKNFEVYVDDILVQSQKAEIYLRDLEGIFANIRLAGLRMKAKK